MAETWILPELVFDGLTLQKSKALQLIDGTVSNLAPAEKAPANARAIPGILSPGFVDLQVNGGGGILFNQTPTTDGITDILAAHRRFGTTGILPTVITDTPEVISAAVDAVLGSQGAGGVLGIHIEGPHISVPRRGTHAAHLVRPLDDRTIAEVERLRQANIPVMITLAPEAATRIQISQLADLGAVVSIGHSDTTAEETHAAIAAGVSCATHLFNAMSPMLNRAPGVTGAVINSDIYAGIIVDGIHVADEMVSLAIRARPVKDRMFLVSDAMPTVGGPDHFSLYGEEVRLEQGRLVNAEGSLAGAHTTQADGVYHLVNHLGIEPSEALRMAITVPARMIGQDRLSNIVGMQTGDIIHLDDSLKFTGYFAA